MIYKIEKYDKENKCWVTLYSSEDCDYINEMVKEILATNRNVWIRLNTLLKTHYMD